MPLHPQLQAPTVISDNGLSIYAEVGIYEGDTVSAVAKAMVPGTIHLFDYEDQVEAVAKRLRSEYGETHQIVKHPCSRKHLDSYNWPLMKMLREGAEKYPLEYVYLDGAHVWLVDALAFLLLDHFIVPGGYIEIDDYNWNHARSLARLKKQERMELYEKISGNCSRNYTEEQIKTCQVGLVIDLLVRPNPNYIEIVPNRLFRKKEKRE